MPFLKACRQRAASKASLPDPENGPSDYVPAEQGAPPEPISAGWDPMWWPGDNNWPVRTEVLERFVYDSPGAASKPGIASKAEAIRTARAADLLVMDEGDIGEDEVLEHRLSCSEFHPGS